MVSSVKLFQKSMHLTKILTLDFGFHCTALQCAHSCNFSHTLKTNDQGHSGYSKIHYRHTVGTKNNKKQCKMAALIFSVWHNLSGHRSSKISKIIKDLSWLIEKVSGCLE